MLEETARVVAIEESALWVETIDKSTCGTCSARAGCGTSLMARWFKDSSYIRVLLDGKDAQHFAVDQMIVVGIPEDVVVKGSLLVYLVPIVAMVLGALCGQLLVTQEWATILGAIVGFTLGAVVVRIHAFISRNDKRLQPVVLS